MQIIAPTKKGRRKWSSIVDEANALESLVLLTGYVA